MKVRLGHELMTVESREEIEEDSILLTFVCLSFSIMKLGFKQAGKFL